MVCTFLGAFALIAEKTPISLVTSVRHPPVFLFVFCVFALNSAAKTGTNFVNFDIGNFYENMPKKIQILLKLDKNIRQLT